MRLGTIVWWDCAIVITSNNIVPDAEGARIMKLRSQVTDNGFPSWSFLRLREHFGSEVNISINEDALLALPEGGFKVCDNRSSVSTCVHPDSIVAVVQA
jgi:hypothetical protein